MPRGRQEGSAAWTPSHAPTAGEQWLWLGGLIQTTAAWTRWLGRDQVWKEHKMRTEINERGRGTTGKAGMGRGHQEPERSKSSRANTKRGATQLSTTDRPSTRPARQPQHREAKGKATADGPLGSLRPRPRMALPPDWAADHGCSRTHAGRTKQKKPHSTASTWHASPAHCKSPRQWGVVAPSRPGAGHLLSPAMSTLTQGCLPRRRAATCRGVRKECYSEVGKRQLLVSVPLAGPALEAPTRLPVWGLCADVSPCLGQIHRC